MDQIEDSGITTNGKKHEKLVYIFNLSEDVWSFISTMSVPQEKQAEIEENANLADRDIFSFAGESDALFFIPKPLDPSFLSYITELLGIKNLSIVTPKKHTGEICLDIMNDPEAYQALVDAANSVRRITLTAYSTSSEFIGLVDKLRESGITVYTPESPEEETVWTVNFFGSKSGIRQLAQQSIAKEPDFRIADGVICSQIFDAAKIAANKYIKENGVVIKTNKGHSGAGVLIFRPGDLPLDYRSCERAIHEALMKESYWQQFPIVIESFINVHQGIAGGFPSVEFKIQKGGKIEYLYYCGMRVTKDGVFKGVEINDGVISDRIAARLIDTGFFIAEQYASAGYRGYFDVDFVAAKNGEIFVTESNTRRTGGTHVYNAGLALVGKDFTHDVYVLSDNMYQLHTKHIVSFETIHALLSPLLFDKKTKEGVVIAAANILSQGKFAYIIVGLTEKRAIEIEAEMEKLLENL